MGPGFHSKLLVCVTSKLKPFLFRPFQLVVAQQLHHLPNISSDNEAAAASILSPQPAVQLCGGTVDPSETGRLLKQTSVAVSGRFWEGFPHMIPYIQCGRIVDEDEDQDDEDDEHEDAENA